MLILSICKVLIDLCLYFLVVCFLLSDQITLSWILLSLFSCALALGIHKALAHMTPSRFFKGPVLVLRYASLILTLSPLLIPEIRSLSLFGILAFVIPACYSTYLSIKEGIHEYLESLEKHFPIFIAAALFITLFGQLIGNPNFSFILFFLFVTILIFTMQIRRIYRSGNLTIKRSLLIFSLLFLLFGAIVLLSSPIIWKAIGSLVRFIYLNLVSKAVALVIRIAALLSAGIVAIISFFASLFHVEVNIEEAPVETMKGAQDMEGVMMDGAAIGGPWTTIISLAIIAAAAFFFFRLINQKRSETFRASGVPETEEKVTLQRRRMPSGATGSVRKTYKKLIAWLNDMGSDITAFSTSEDVSRSGSAYAETKINEELRDLYRKARYSSSAMTDAEAKKAKELSRRIMK